MGCGGSRADAIEPRYYESWTRETESTWLTYTDSDTPPSNAAPDSSPEAGGLHAVPRDDVFFPQKFHLFLLFGFLST
ncbi:brain and acute leukemia cytoplasmic protein isoform X2 [Rhinolophus ferrumequinum]|uniref:brain and acute leukemia cytoplasmic protein isoform X2 n=1 Tax=Rhinolophus ferrumequinum TaxID=59479 RepID=UPI00140FE586|nr:brain and acute leukemia cytoplasmic protein isoform X2 [Rhinolophus ferrumequinum]